MNTICHDDIVSDSRRTDGGTTLKSSIAATEMIVAWSAGFNAPKPDGPDVGSVVMNGA